MVGETVGLKSNGSSILQVGQERLCGLKQRWRHVKQVTCWQGRTEGSVSSSRQTGQEMPNLHDTKHQINSAPTSAYIQIIKKAGRDLSSLLMHSSWRELRIWISFFNVTTLLTSGDSRISCQTVREKSLFSHLFLNYFIFVDHLFFSF